MTKPIISVTDINKAVGDRQLLSDVSFDITQQSLVSIIGPNGAGKSTLVNIMLGLDADYTGTVTIDPQERIQYIPQLTINDPYQLPLSVKEYLSIGSSWLYNPTGSQTNFAEALSHVGVSDDRLKQPWQSLSGGERQRIAIARALLANPTILVLDEPLAAVDYASRQGLYELIRHLQQDHRMTVVLVSHDIDSVLPLSDQVLCLNKTLHTNCHPTELRSNSATSIHHHC